MDQTTTEFLTIGLLQSQNHSEDVFHSANVDYVCRDLGQLKDPALANPSGILLLDSGLSKAGLEAAQAQATAWARSFDSDPSSAGLSAEAVGIYVEHLRQRSYLATICTWVYYWLSRILFGVRKAPAYPAAIYFQNAKQLREFIGQLETAGGSNREWRTGWKSLNRWLGWIDKPQSELDQLLHAAAVSRLTFHQMESESGIELPRGSHWKQRVELAVTSVMAVAKLVRDWWNWRVFSSQNPKSLTQHSCTPESSTPDSFPGVTIESAANPSVGARLFAWCSLLLCSIVVIGTQTDYPLFEPDEARNSQLAINIYQTGDWVSLHLGAEPYWDKPPAVAWGTAVAYHLFGVSAWSTRLVSNITAVLTILMSFYFGRRMVGFRAAWLGSFLLLLCVGFVICGRYATMDAAITCCATAMLGSIYMAVRGEEFRYGYWLIACLACGVGLLVKGPVIGVLTLPPLLLWMWMTGNGLLLRFTPWATMAVVAVAIAGPWFIIMGVTEPDFLIYFFWKHHVVRFSDAFNHREPFWFYIPVVVLGTFPASLLLPTLIPLFRRYGQSCQRALTPSMGLLTLYALWVIGFFSLSDSKLPTYILPSFPAVALLYAVAGVAFVDDLSRQSQTQVNRFLNYFLSIPKRTAVTFAIAIVAFSIVSVVLFKQNAWSGWFSVIAGVGVVLSVIAWLSHKNPVAAIGTSLTLGLLFVITMTSYVLPSVSSFRSIQRAAAQLHQREEFKDLPIVFYSHENYGSQIWLPEGASVSFDEYDMVKTIDYLNAKQTCLLVSRLEAMEMLRSNLNQSLRLSSIKGARHLYLCHPVVSPDSKPAQEAVDRLADRLQTVTYTR